MNLISEKLKFIGITVIATAFSFAEATPFQNRPKTRFSFYEYLSLFAV